MRRLALALPAVVEQAHFSVPDFRVRQRIFAALPDGDRSVVLKTTPANLDVLVGLGAQTFTNEWRGRWVRVRLDRVPRALLHDLVVEAWRLVAPKRLVAEWEVSRRRPAR